MTRKKIDLGTATEEWMRSRFLRPNGISGYDSHMRYRLGYATDPDHKDHEERKLKTFRETMIGDALDISVDSSYIEPRHGSITLFATGHLDAKRLNRLMNTQFVLDGLVLSFDYMDLEASTDGDSYMGEWTESPKAQYRIHFKTEAKKR